MHDRVFPRIDGLGFAAGGAVQGASFGSKAGTIIPGVGNVIGAIAGAIIGGLLGKKKPVRPSGAQVAQCQDLLKQYEEFIATNPAPVGRALGYAQLKDLYWCIQAIYAGHYLGTKDPRWFDGGFILNEDIARQTVKAVFNTPVGAQLTIKPTDWKDPKGRIIRSSGLTFTNPPFISLQDLNDKYFMPVVVKVCQDTAGKGAPGCPDYYNLPVMKHLMLDLLDYAASVELPQVVLPTEPPPGAPSTVKLPDPAATPVPAAVAPSIPNPPALPPQPTNKDVQVAVQDIVKNLQQNSSGLTPEQVADIANKTALQWLQSQGVKSSAPEVKEVVATTAQQAAAGQSSMWLVGIAAAAGLFALARPGPSVSRRRRK